MNSPSLAFVQDERTGSRAPGGERTPVRGFLISVQAISVTNIYPGGYWEDLGCNWFGGN